MRNSDHQISDAFSLVFILAREKSSSPFIRGIEQRVAESGIVQSAIQLSKKLKTTLFSVYLDVFMPYPESKFKEDTMECVQQSDEHVTTAKRISCTVELGIREVPHPGEQGMGRILLKPKIVLEVNALSLSNLHGS